MKIALAQLNLCVGDIAGNTSRIIDTLRRARDEGARLVAFPELAVTGYPPEDLLFRPGFHARAAHALRQIAAATHGITVVIGHPEKVGDAIYNSASVIEDGAVRVVYRKQRLPNYEVFDEKRYFTPGDAPAIIDLDGVGVGLSICEDIWDPTTAVAARRAGAELILNINASPYSANKRAARLAAVQAAVAAAALPVLYVNLVGGQDELVFDGGSLAVAADGAIVAAAPEFEESLLTVDLVRAGDHVAVGGPIAPALVGIEAVYRALVLGVRDYIGKNQFKGAVIGLSGGIDSALTLAIAVDALGAGNVAAISMPSRYTAQMSIDDALEQARNQGCECHVVGIEAPFSAFNDVLAPVFAGRAADVTEENIQARCRGIILMAISNKTGRIVLTTGNKSEMAVGYATLYGDMAGGFAPLKDCPKTLVYELAIWRNLQQTAPVIPPRVIEREPSAELRPDQKDSDSLPPYDVLDPILERYVELDQTPQQIAAAGFALETVKRVARMVDRNEYKRRQAAPGVRLSTRAFGRDRRFPITSRYDEQEPVPES
jgi:NAD+ synthase (glutamine-hydrolysing)